MENVVQLQSKPLTAVEQAVEVIEFLNTKTGRKFPARNPRGMPTTNCEVIMHRLKEGYSVSDCKAVIASKCREWMHDEKMSRYLTPDTLFRRSNFETYLGSLGE
jgi:uncharacterized phage protein (TIGR02220 family)